MELVIDASRNRSGGARAHIIGILNSGVDPLNYGIRKVHVLSYGGLLDKIDDKPWLNKVSHKYLEKGLIFQLYWQVFISPKFYKAVNADLCLYTSASAIVRAPKSIVMSRDMLSFEPGHIKLHPFIRDRARLVIIGYLQVMAMRKATNVVFLTKYAKNIISKRTGQLKDTTIIPHGLDQIFQNSWRVKKNLPNNVRIIYISDSSHYKHHINVLKALLKLRYNGYNIRLILVGAEAGTAAKEVLHFIKDNGLTDHVETTPFIDKKDIAKIIRDSHIGLFASSCENMPNTLVELMGSGIPLACSNRGPMLEILESNKFTFNPFIVSEIESSLLEIIMNYPEAVSHGKILRETAARYSWSKCAESTYMNIKTTKENN